MPTYLLHDYLINNPQILREFQVCESSVLVSNAQTLVKTGHYNLALRMFNKAKTLNQKLDFEPEIAAAPAFIKQGEKLVKQGKLNEAVTAYNQARKIDPALEIPDNDFKILCNSANKTALNPPCP